IYSLSLSADGTKLASASFNNTVRFWDAHSGDPIDQPLQHDDGVYAVTFSPSGEFVASGGIDDKVSIWRSVDLTPKPLTTLSGHENHIWRIAYLAGGTRIVTCAFDKTVRLWDVENGEQEGTSMEHEDRLFGLAITRDGKRILSGGDSDRIIKVWDTETHELIEEWGNHTSWIYCIVIGVLSVCFSPDGEKLACAVGNTSEPGVIHVYDVESGKLVLGPMEGHRNVVYCVLWSLDGSRLFSASYDETIRCWNSDAGKSIGDPWKGHTGPVYSLSLSPDGTKLASASYDNTVRFWDAYSGYPIEQPLQHDDGVYAVTFSPSGEFVASGGLDDKVSIWRSVDLTAKPLTTISGHEDTIWGIAYLPGGTRIATCSGDKTVRIWDVENGEQEGTSMEHEDRLFGLAVTRDGKRVLSGGNDKRIRVWDVETHELMEEWGRHTEPVNCVLWSLDGTQLFSADHTIRCWNSDTGESVGEPWKGHTDSVTSFSLSPDGTKLASASWDLTVRFWDARSGDPIDQPLQHDEAVHAVTFSPSGEFVASGGSDNKVSIWRVPWWDDSQKQVTTAFAYLPTPFLTVFIPAGT
ncbi:hypothetical protein PAXINDRAFT_80977, partial [Paxillus involutus ATCC 200175]